MAFDHPPECHIHQSQNEVQVDGNEDDNRLSLLPDDILLNILERLPLHSAVHTSTLSRRWRRLPFLLSRLAIDIDEFRRRFGARAAVPSLMASYTEATKTLLAPTTERAIKLLRLAFYLCADLSCLRSIGHAVATAVAGSGGRPDDLAAVDLTLWTEVRSSRCKEHHAALYRRRFVSFLDACPGAFRCLTSLILRNLQFAEPDVPNILSSCHRLRELCLKYCGQLIIAESAGQSFVLKIDAPSSSQLVTLSLVECLLAWDRACTSKECGGLGIKRLDDQNHCLLMKFIHKLHEPTQLPWKTWFHRHTAGGDDDSFLCRLVREELPRYRDLTMVRIGNGEHTSFWHDKWALNGTLAETFPVLFSFCTNEDITVCQAMATPLQQQLRPRLSRIAEGERRSLGDCLAHVQLSHHADTRFLPNFNNQPFSTKGAHLSIHVNDAQDPDALRFWNVKLPARVKFFGWLLHHQRLKTRANLYAKNIRTFEESFCESCPGTLETDDHLFLHCPRASALWTKLSFAICDGAHRMPWTIGCVATLPNTVRTDVVLLLLWHIWKARNSKIFDHQDLSPTEVIRRAAHDLDLWSCRYKKHKTDVALWHAFLLSAT